MLARLAFALAALAASSASAQPYLGGSIGQAQYRDACAGAAAGLTCESGDSAIRLFVGYSFTPHVAIEWAYSTLGTVRASTGEAADLSAADLSLVGSWPIASHFSVHGRLGIYAGAMDGGTRAAQTDNTTPPCPVLVPGAPPGIVLPPCPPPAPVPPERGWQSGTSTDITYGLGVSYAMTQAAALRVEWQRFPNFGGDGGPKLDVDLFSIGVLVHVQ